MTVSQRWLLLGALNALLAVAAGAFGAHGLKPRVDPSMLTVFETGARYHMYHALGLLAVGLLALRSTTGVDLAGTAMLVGIVLFSGSLYAMTLTGVTRLGAITPIGGLAFLLGWAALAMAALRAS